MSARPGTTKDTVNTLMALGFTAQITSFDAADSRRVRIDKRTASVLDSLAAVAIHEKMGEVIAVGAQIEHSSILSDHSGKLILFVANNDVVPQRTIDHLYHVWSRMKRIAQHVHRVHRPFPMEERRLMVQDIYRHNFPKFSHRLKKGSDAIRNFLLEWIQEVFPVLPPDRAETNILLPNVLSMIGRLFTLLNGSADASGYSIDVVEHPDFVTTMDGLWKCCQDLEQNGLKTVKEAIGLSVSPQKFLKALSKVTLLHSAIVQLERFSRSARLYRLFAKEITIQPISLPKTAINLPEDEKAWKKIYNDAFDVVGKQPRVSAKVDRLFKTSAQKWSSKQVECPIHCECAILQHFHQRSLDKEFKPVNYIGVSKLSCAGCSAVFETYNQSERRMYYPSERRMYYTRGSHSKWYFPWSIPEVGNGNHFINNVYLSLARTFTASMDKRGIDDCDSSAISTDSREFDIDHHGVNADIRNHAIEHAEEILAMVR